MLQQQRIMVVDDDEDYCFVTEMILQQAGLGNEILKASDGLEALKKLQGLAASGEGLPAIIFLDLKMPVMDGFEFLEEATSSPDLNLSHTRIFVTTSSVLPKDKDKAASFPIAGFIPKPLTQETVIQLIG